jgi:hypothetical protein
MEGSPRKTETPAHQDSDAGATNRAVQECCSPTRCLDQRVGEKPTGTQTPGRFVVVGILLTTAQYVNQSEGHRPQLAVAGPEAPRLHLSSTPTSSGDLLA